MLGPFGCRFDRGPLTVTLSDAGKRARREAIPSSPSTSSAAGHLQVFFRRLLPIL
jgi:hypothetical protein